MPTLDYTPLTEEISNQGVTRLSKTQWITQKYKLPAIVVCVMLLFVIVIVIIRSVDLSVIDSMLLPLSLAIAIPGLLLVGIVHGLRRRSKYLAHLTKFAEVNKAELTHDILPTGYSGLIFDNGYGRKVLESIAFNDGYEIGNYEFVTGSGKNRRLHPFMFVRVALERPLPNMVLDAKDGNIFGLTSLPDTFNVSQKLQLEGDFNTYFDLYVPKEYERDALYVFTPDVMHALIEHGNAYDIEIVGNELYLYKAGKIDMTSETALKEIISITDTLAAELKNQTRRYADERVAASEAGIIVADAGKQLKKGANWRLLGIIVVVVAFMFTQNIAMEILSPGVAIAYGILSGIFFWGVIIFLVVRLVRKHR